MNTLRAVKIGLAWTSIVWVVCFLGVALVPGIREWFALYAFHSVNAGLGENAMTLTTFVSGLVIWNVIVGAGIWLAGFLGQYIKN